MWPWPMAWPWLGRDLAMAWESENGIIFIFLVAVITIDEEEPVSGNAPGQYVGLDLSSDLYVGGVPDISNVNRHVGFKENFAGSFPT